VFNKKAIAETIGIEVNKSLLHDRGVFATVSFKPGEIIERSPIILLQQHERELLQTTSLFSYYFLINKEETLVALGLGYSSLYNHNSPANAVYTISLKSTTIIIKAHKRIYPGEEITLNYNGSPDDDTVVYFPTKAIE
jgi:uncharacterized protein